MTRRAVGHQHYSVGAHLGDTSEMAATDNAIAIGNADVEVGAIGGEAACERENLQVALEDGELLLAGQPERCCRQAAYATEHPAGLFPLIRQHLLEAQPQVSAWYQTDRQHFYGLSRTFNLPQQHPGE